MKRHILTSSLCLSLGLLSHTAQAKPLPLGATLPNSNTALQSVGGKNQSLNDAVGEKGTLIIFTCNHCPFVKAWDTRIAALANAAKLKGVGVLALNPNDPKTFGDDDFKTMQARAKELALQYPYAIDAKSTLARTFGATRTPEVFLFDAKKSLIYHGTIDDNSRDASAVQKHYLQNAIEALLQGKEPTPAQTKALGCSIKFYQDAP